MDASARVQSVRICRGVALNTELGGRDAAQDTFRAHVHTVNRQASKAARKSSIGRPRSRRAPRIMSPDAPEKQSKYSVFANRQHLLCSRKL